MADGDDESRKSGAGRRMAARCDQAGRAGRSAVSSAARGRQEERPDATTHGACDGRSVQSQYPRAGNAGAGIVGVRFSPRSKCSFAAAVAAFLLAVAAEPASAQDQPAPRDTIFARKILMGAIDMNMGENQ